MRIRNTGRGRARLALAIAMLSGTAGAVAAADGRVPIYQAPLTITDPGTYYLTRDVTHTGAGESIVIQSSDVTIDFNGHTLTKDNAGNYAVAMNGNYTNITIRNGTVRGGNIGIRLENTTGSDFAVHIEDMELYGNLNEAIYVEGQSLIGSSQVFIERNVIHDNGNDGVHLRWIWGGRVADNVIQSSTSGSTAAHGIYLNSCRGVTVTRNTISHYDGDGIRAWWSWYCAFDWNHITYNDGYGLNIFDGDSHVFSNNRAYGNGNGGFTIPGAEGHVNAGGNYPPP